MTSSEKIGRFVERGAGEIEDEGPSHDCHLDDPEFVVILEHFRNGTAANVFEGTFTQAQIDVSFAGIVALPFMDLDGRSSPSGLAFDCEYATMNARSEGIAKNQSVPVAVALRAEKRPRWIAHGHTTNINPRPFGGTFGFTCTSTAASCRWRSSARRF